MCELLVGLPEVNVLGVEDEAERPLRVYVESRLDQGWCRLCGCRARVKDRDSVELVDLACFGRRAELVWRKVRWCCVESACPAGSWTIVDDRIAPALAALTDRAARWATRQVGRRGRTVNEVADELGCDWHTVNSAVIAYGEALLDADVERVGPVDALGFDETLFVRRGPRHRKEWCTSIVDVGGPHRAARLIDIVAGRSAAKVCDWLDDQPDTWRQVIRYGVLDLSGPYRKVFNDALDHVTQIADPFHVVKHAKETIREIYDLDDPAVAAEFIDELTGDMLDREMPPEVRSLGRTLRRWRDHILAWHQARAINGPTEAMNNLIKRIKRIGFGFRRLRHYRIRALLYAGQPNWDLLPTINPAEIR